MKEIIRASIGDFHRCWKRLFLTGICYQLIAFILLTPLVSILFRTFVSISGKTLLADQDILFFFLSPIGWICLIAVGGLWLGIFALQMAAMMAIVADSDPRGMPTLGALRFAMLKAWPTIHLAARIAFWTSVAIAPFLGIAALVYFTLLGESDINFYLTKKPPVFYVALGIGAIIVIAMLGVVLRLFAGWAFALPLVLFESVRPGKALGLSRDRATGHRVKLLLLIAGWSLATIVVSLLAASVVIMAARLIVSQASDSLHLLAIAIGISLIVVSGVNLIVGLVSTTSLATLEFNFYQTLGQNGQFDAQRLELAVPSSNRLGIQLTRGRLIAGVAVGVLVAMITGLSVMESVSMKDTVVVIGHRGASESAPENTMASVKKAIADGADWVEIDVQETADGVVVVIHDSDFMKLADNKLKIWDATLKDLENIDIGSWFAPEFKDERVPTLEAVLEECKGKVGLYIELKYYGHDVDLEQKVIDLVEDHGMVDDVVVISLKVAAIEKVKKLRPEWKTGLLMTVSVGDLAKIQADTLAVNATFVDRRFVRSANQVGKDVCVWTVNDAVSMSSMIGCGVNGLITDDPALARSVLKERANMNALQRLTLELGEVFGVVPEVGEQ